MPAICQKFVRNDLLAVDAVGLLFALMANMSQALCNIIHTNHHSNHLVEAGQIGKPSARNVWQQCPFP